MNISIVIDSLKEDLSDVAELPSEKAVSKAPFASIVARTEANMRWPVSAITATPAAAIRCLLARGVGTVR